MTKQKQTKIAAAVAAEREGSGSMTSAVVKAARAAANSSAGREGCHVALYCELCRTLVKMSVQPG
jgi:hypothetical protein